MTRRRWLAVPLVAAVALAGCGSPSKKSTPTTAAKPPATSSAGASTTSTPATSTPPPTTAPPTTSRSGATTTVSSATTALALSNCTTGRLTGTVGRPNGTAGSIDYLLELLNTGSVPCLLQGYPGVSVVAGADGHQVGAAAVRITGPAPDVVVDPGHGADARVSVADAGNFPTACRVTAFLGFRIYPPNNTASLFVPQTGQTCADPAYRTLGVGALQAP